jgi:hypothetical protein
MGLGGCLMVLAMMGMILLVPFLLVWSLNTLFPALAIPYDIKTWAAALILMSLGKARNTTQNK